jgi:hypothetical protein
MSPLFILAILAGLAVGLLYFIFFKGFALVLGPLINSFSHFHEYLVDFLEQKYSLNTQKAANIALVIYIILFILLCSIIFYFSDQQ